MPYLIHTAQLALIPFVTLPLDTMQILYTRTVLPARQRTPECCRLILKSCILNIEYVYACVYDCSDSTSILPFPCDYCADLHLFVPVRSAEIYQSSITLWPDQTPVLIPGPLHICPSSVFGSIISR
jgi:hypothetical protein